MNRLGTLSFALPCATVLAAALLAPPAASQATQEEAGAIAAEAYVYGYPLVLMDATRAKMTAVSSPTAGSAPINQFANMPAFPDASFTDVVSPNADTLYSSAWLDLAKEPIVLSVPDTGGRYYLMPMLSGWTDVFASPGKRTTGTAKGDFAICGPAWKGALPAGVKELRAPSDMVWIIGRTQTNGVKDFDAVHKLQAEYKLTPLSAFGKPYTPPQNVPVEASASKVPPVEQVARMDGVTFLGRLAALLKANPPAAADAPMVAKLAKLGVVPGQPFKPDAALVASIEAGVAKAKTMLLDETRKLTGGDSKGWTMVLGLGQYGTDYGKRAVVALFGLGANLSADAVYPTCRTDAEGKPLSGANKYVIHFDKGQTPPVDAFWSLTMYNDKQFFVANPINRFAIGDRDAMKLNADGSLDVWFQNASPGADKESNWLPAPMGDFNLVLRMYWPKEEVLKGAYKIPDVKKVN